MNDRGVPPEPPGVQLKGWESADGRRHGSLLSRGPGAKGGASARGGAAASRAAQRRRPAEGAPAARAEKGGPWGTRRQKGEKVGEGPWYQENPIS